MYIAIPQTKEQHWASFSKKCSERDATTQPGFLLPEVRYKLDRPATREELHWYYSQRRPGRYAESYLEYAQDTHELVIPLIAQPRN